MSKLDEFSTHEALDRAHMGTVHLIEALSNHPAIRSDKKLARLQDKAVDALSALYQAIGATRARGVKAKP